MDELEQVRQVAQSLGIKVHPNAKVETIKAKINQQQAHLVEDVMKHRAEVDLTVSENNSEEDVLKAVAPFMKKEGFTIKFLPDNTWYMAYKGREESGHMSVGLRVIAMKASNVAEGKRSPRSFGAAPGTNGMSYSDNILA